MNDIKGRELGELMLLDALARSYDVSVNNLGSMAVIVDPLNDNAKHFYTKIWLYLAG